MTTQTENEEMQKLAVNQIEDLNLFQVNPLNVRNWATYSITAKIQDGKLVFVCDHEQAPKNLQELVNSLIRYENTEETVNGLAVIHIDEPLTVAPKNKEGVNILLTGNSRIVLIRNMIEAYHNDLSAEDQSIYGLSVEPIRYQAKTDFKPNDLLTLQMTLNSTIPLTSWQKAQLVYKRVQELRDSEPEKYAGNSKTASGNLKSQICSEFPISHQWYNLYLQLAEQIDPLFREKIELGEIQNVEVAVEMQKLLKHKDLGQHLDAKSLWILVMDATHKAGLFFPSVPTVKKVKKALEEEYGTIEENEEDSVNGETTDSTEETSNAKNETKLAEIERLRSIERVALNDEVVGKATNLVDVIVGVDPTQYDLDDAIKLHLMFSEFASKINKMKTTAQKELAIAEKAAKKEAEKAEKAAKATTEETKAG